MTDPEFDLETLVTVGAYASPWEAQLARACLEAEGVDSVVADEHLGRIWCATTVGGIKLKVWEEDAPRAAELLRSRKPIPEIYLVTDSDGPASERCPSCKSDNLALERWSVLGFLGTWLLLGLALPVPRRRWTCRGCSSVWKDGDLGLVPEMQASAGAPARDQAWTPPAAPLRSPPAPAPSPSSSPPASRS